VPIIDFLIVAVVKIFKSTPSLVRLVIYIPLSLHLKQFLLQFLTISNYCRALKHSQIFLQDVYLVFQFHSFIFPSQIVLSKLLSF